MINPRDYDPTTRHLPPEPPPPRMAAPPPDPTPTNRTLAPAEPDVAELDAVAGGLNPEQEIRAQALQLSVDTWIGCRWDAEEPNAIIGLAVRYADWIRAGERGPS